MGLYFYFYGVFVRFSTKGVQKHHNCFLRENPCQKLLAEKVEEKKTCFLSSFPFDLFYRVFGRFSAQKHPQKNLKSNTPKKRYHGTRVPTSLFLCFFVAPCCGVVLDKGRLSLFLKLTYIW
jgi:hypothetical protein